MNKPSRANFFMASILILTLCSSAISSPQTIRWSPKTKVPKTKTPKIPDPVKTVGDVINSTGKTLGEVTGNVVRVTGDALHDTGKTIEIAHSNTATAIRKAGDDTGAEVRRAGKNIEEAAVAIRKYTERTVKGYTESLTDAERRVREGKVLDVLFHLAIDPIRNDEKNLALATQESTLVDATARTAASVYGGPQGAAAYAAWSTYRRTGDADLAIRVGIITGLASKGFEVTGEMPVGNNWDIAKKAAITGSIGGVAVAASGGDEAAIRDAFLMAGGMVLVKDGYKKYTGLDFDPTGADGPAYCMKGDPRLNPECAPPLEALKLNEDGSIFYDNKGNPEVDFSKLDKKRFFVGEWSKPGETGNFKLDNSKFMGSVARIPGMNAMAIFHDQWAVSWKMGELTTIPSILPAVVLTYTGTYVATGAAINNQIQDVNINTAQTDGGIQQPRVTAASTKEDEPTSFLCVKEGLSRSIFIATRDDNKDFACVVIYQKDKESKEDYALWYALKDEDYCKTPASKLAQNHVKQGWSCFAR